MIIHKKTLEKCYSIHGVVFNKLFEKKTDFMSVRSYNNDNNNRICFTISSTPFHMDKCISMEI